MQSLEKNLKTVALTIIIFSLFYLLNIKNVNALETKNYNIPLGQSLFSFEESLYNNPNTNWESKNTEIATVENGLIKTRCLGKTKILASLNDKIITEININVVPSQGIKFCFPKQNIMQLNKEYDLVAITEPGVEKIRFIIDVSGKKKILETQNYINKNSSFYFNAKIILETPGYFDVNTIYFKDGAWNQGQNGNFNIFVAKEDYNFSQVIKRRASQKCIDFIKAWEGFLSSFHKDPLAKNTFDIGYGNVLMSGESFFDNISEEEASALLTKQINGSDYTEKLNIFLIENNIESTQEQFDALLSFCYNLGTRWMICSDLKNMILATKNENGKGNLSNLDEETFANEVLLYHHASKKCVLGLLYRRINELQIFFFGKYEKDGKLNRYGFSVPACINNMV